MAGRHGKGMHAVATAAGRPAQQPAQQPTQHAPGTPPTKSVQMVRSSGGVSLLILLARSISLAATCGRVGAGEGRVSRAVNLQALLTSAERTRSQAAPPPPATAAPPPEREAVPTCNPARW